MTLKEWFRIFHSRPLKIAATFLLVVWLMFALKSYLSVTEKQTQVMSETADLLSMSTQSHDRAMTETLLETLLIEGGASSAALCEGGKQIVGANQDLDGCRTAQTFFERPMIRKIPGSTNILLEAKFNLLTSFASIFSFLGFGLLLVTAGFYFIHAAQKRIQEDILRPVLEKLMSNEKFEIHELNELRERFRASRDAEEQRAVILAIEENNVQVAHDVRSPINSIGNLLNRVEVIDAELKAALEKAIARAQATAEALLSNEKVLPSENRSYTYDFAELVRDMAIEKRPLFVDGKIEVDAPASVVATSSLSPDALGRILSNLIDNAILACEVNKEIEIFLTSEPSSVLLNITDSGCGMPPEFLARIGEKGLSSRDKSKGEGHGRGVYSAIQTIESASGTLEFESVMGHGTVASIQLVARPLPVDFSGDLIFIDDNDLNLLTWELAAQDAGLKCTCYRSMNEFFSSALLIPKGTPVFIDSDLGHGEKGQDHAPRLREIGFERIYISTNYAHLVGASLPSVVAVISKDFEAVLSALGKVQPRAGSMNRSVYAV
jgi:signal transduction histidine kinase